MSRSRTPGPYPPGPPGGGYPPGGYSGAPGGYPQGGYAPGGYHHGGHPQRRRSRGSGLRGLGGFGRRSTPPTPPPAPRRPPGPHPAEDLPLAPVGRRAAARALETGILWVLGVALIMPFMLIVVGGGEGVAEGSDAGGDAGAASSPQDDGLPLPAVYFTFFIVFVVIPFVYEFVQLAFRHGQTFGKAYFGLRVVTADPPGEPLSIFTAARRAAVNNIVYWFGCGVGVLVGHLWAIWDKPLHQAMHDKLAGTVVIDDRVEYDDEESPDEQVTSVYDRYTG